MMPYLIYDPVTGVIKRWFVCQPENVRSNIAPGETAAWISGSPPMLGRIIKIFDPETRTISDGEELHYDNETISAEPIAGDRGTDK